VILVSFLSYAYLVEFWFAGSYAYGTVSSYEAEAYEWIHSNTPKDSVILTYSYTPSYMRLISLAGRKTISYVTYNSEAAPWSLEIVFNSHLPEVLLYSLEQLGVDYIFLTSHDMDLLKKLNKSAFLGLLKAFSIAYESDGIKIYEVPEYPLFNDSNYVLVEPTLDFIDRKGQTSLEEDLEEKSLVSYQMTFNMLLSSKLNFSILPDMEIMGFDSNKVYIFPSNWRVTDNIYNELFQTIPKGAHLIFLNPYFASLDELSRTHQNFFLEYLGMRLGKAASSSSVIFKDGFHMNFSRNLTVRQLVSLKETSIEIIANYTLHDGSKTPYVFQKNLEEGSASFIYLGPLLDSGMLENIDPRKFLAHTFLSCVRQLSKPNIPNEPLRLPYPSDLFEFTEPIITNIYDLKGLDGYLFCYNNLNMSGQITLKSDYILWRTANLPVSEVVVEDPISHTVILGETLQNLTIRGHVNVTLETNTSTTILDNSANKLVHIYSMTPIHLQLTLVNGEMTFDVEENGLLKHFHLTNGKIAISTAHDGTALSLQLKLPVVFLEGKIETWWEGVFWYNGLLYSTLSSPKAWPMSGIFTFQVLHCSRVVLIKLTGASEVTVAY